jgi:hypothetical protein
MLLALRKNLWISQVVNDTFAMPPFSNLGDFDDLIRGGSFEASKGECNKHWP